MSEIYMVWYLHGIEYYRCSIQTFFFSWESFRTNIMLPSKNTFFYWIFPSTFYFDQQNINDNGIYFFHLFDIKLSLITICYKVWTSSTLPVKSGDINPLKLTVARYLTDTDFFTNIFLWNFDIIYVFCAWFCSIPYFFFRKFVDY